MKIPKCPKTVTGKHKFCNTSYKVFHTSTDRVGACVTVQRPIVCDYCGLIDDRKVKHSETKG